MQQPKISVVTVSFNHAEFIRDNIESVLAQNYPNFEHIIVDGGSTDGTVDILKEYPHLLWTSEPDNGQTDALNRGFSKASGDIIAWLNSDDWYPPEIFHDVAKELEHYPVLLGLCQMTDREGKPTELMSNRERSWFDLLKYWVYHSVPAQPSIFFTRQALEESKLPDGKYLDESLEYGMDFEFWLRLAERYPFTRRIEKVLSYYRMYEENKTGAEFNRFYIEATRLFKRYANRRYATENSLCCIIPVKSVEENLVATLDSIHAQTLKDCQVLLVGYAESKSERRDLKRYSFQLAERYDGLPLHYTWSDQPDYVAALNAGIVAACATNVVFLRPESRLPEDFCFEARNLMNQDSFALALPLAQDLEFKQSVATEEDGLCVFDAGVIFKTPFSLNGMLVRKVALMELGGLRNWKSETYAAKELLLRLVYRAWQISVDSKLSMYPAPGVAAAALVPKDGYTELMGAKLVSDLQDEFETEPFAQTRAEHGLTIVVKEELVEAARSLLAKVDPRWIEHI